MRLTATTRLLVLLSAVGAGACDENILDPMADRQPKVLPYKESDFYADGLAMKAPPPGTVPRERLTGNVAVTTGHTGEPEPLAANGEPVAKYVKQVPLPVTRKLLELGRKRYDITCGACHGPVGDGDSIVARQFALRPPPSLHLYLDRAPGYFYEVITKGFGMMAPYAAELTVEERWAVVAYVQALQLSQNYPVDRLPADARARLQQGAGAQTPPPSPPHPAPKEAP